MTRLMLYAVAHLQREGETCGAGHCDCETRAVRVLATFRDGVSAEWDNDNPAWEDRDVEVELGPRWEPLRWWAQGSRDVSSASDLLWEAHVEAEARRGQAQESAEALEEREAGAGERAREDEVAARKNGDRE